MTYGGPSTQQIARERAEAEASWRHITDAEIREKIRALDAHPMRPILGRFLATAVNRHVPLKLGLLPPEFLKHLDA